MTDAIMPSANPILKALEKAGDVSRPLILANIERIRRAMEDASPADVEAVLTKEFLAAVTISGGAAGAAAAVPAFSTPVSLAAAVADSGWFLVAAATYTFSVSELHGLSVDDVVRRRTLLLGVLMGDAGSSTIQRAAGRTGPHWGRILVDKVSREQLLKINAVLGKNFVTKYGTKQGILVLGKQVPLGLGLVIGGLGNRAFGHFTVRNARKAFGPAPAEWADIGA